MGRLGHARLCSASHDDTNASFRTESQSFLHGARNCGEWPDKLLRVASNTASARRSALRLKPSHRSLIRAPSGLARIGQKFVQQAISVAKGVVTASAAW
jgi:hypothetical protein